MLGVFTISTYFWRLDLKIFSKWYGAAIVTKKVTRERLLPFTFTVLLHWLGKGQWALRTLGRKVGIKNTWLSTSCLNKAMWEVLERPGYYLITGRVTDPVSCPPLLLPLVLKPSFYLSMSSLFTPSILYLFPSNIQWTGKLFVKLHKLT